LIHKVNRFYLLSSQTISSVSVLILSCRVNLGVPNERFLRGCVTLFSCLLKEGDNEKKFPWGNTRHSAQRQIASHCPLTELALMTASVGFHKIYETAIPYKTAVPNPTGQRPYQFCTLFHMPVRLYADSRGLNSFTTCVHRQKAIKDTAKL
jgi:hypothetical protein